MIAGGIGVLVVMAIVVLIVVGSGKNNGDAAPAATPLPTPFVEAAGGIAFETTRDGNLGIYVMDADGSAQTRLTNDQAEDRDPAWSANGRKIAFTSMRDGDAEIYVMNADGSAQTRLTDSQAVEGYPHWSSSDPVANNAPTATAAPTRAPTPTATSVETPIAAASPCAGPPDASAEEFALQIQSREGNNVVSGGVIIRSGGTVTFGPKGETKSAGFWKSIDNLKYTVMFSDSKGDPFALTELQGDVQWDETSCIIKGAESFIGIQIEPNTWLNISRREVVQGHLVLTDEKGNKYVILLFSPSFDGAMARQ